MIKVEASALRSRAHAWVFFFLLVALSMRLLASALNRHVLLTAESPLLYHAATLGFNYFDFGFVRRGVAGSLVSLLGSDRLAGTAIFHVLSATAVAAGAATLFARLKGHWHRKAAFALLMCALMLRWAEDPGRTDMAVAALLCAAALALTSGHFVLSCVCVSVSLGVHETGLVFGLPLLAGLLVDQARWRRLDRRATVLGAIVLLGSLAFYVALGALPHADAATMVSVVRSRLPRHDYVDWAIYFAISGSRGVQTSLCQNLGDPTYVIHLATGLLVIGLYVTLLRERKTPTLASALLVAVPPFLFLSTVANDLSRWAVLAAFNVWILCSASADVRTGVRRSGAWLRVAAAALVIPLIHPKTWRIEDPIFSPVPVIDRVVRELGGPRTPRFSEALERCDPGWRQVLDGSGSQPALR